MTDVSLIDDYTGFICGDYGNYQNLDEKVNQEQQQEGASKSGHSLSPVRLSKFQDDFVNTEEITEI